MQVSRYLFDKMGIERMITSESQFESQAAKEFC